MANTPTPKTQKEALVLELLDHPLLNHIVLAAALYPTDSRTTASSKFSNKRKLMRYQRFNETEQDAIVTIVQQQLQPLLATLHQLTGEPQPTV